MEVISTRRLILRDFEREDWKSVHDYASDPEVVRYVEFGPNSEEESRIFTEKALQQKSERPRKNFTLAIVAKVQNALIGGCGLYVSNPKNREGYIGYVLNRNFWGQGYATEAAKGLQELGFNKLKLHRIFATCDAKNIASAHVLEKIDMRQEGRLRENGWVRGKWRDSLLYAILEQEWTMLEPREISQFGNR